MSVQLRVRTEYSFGATYAPIDRLVSRLVEMGVTTAGIVDNDTWGHVAWHRACRAAGIKPALGVELIVSDDDDVKTKMWFLALNSDGLKELYRFTSKAHRQPVIDKFGRWPRLYPADLSVMSDNIVIFAGDVVDRDLLADSGAVIDLNPASNVLNLQKKRIAEESGAPIVWTSDNLIAYEDDRPLLEICGGQKKVSPQHLIDLPEFDASAIVDAIEDYDLPKAPMIHVDGDLSKLCWDGLRGKAPIDRYDEYEARMLYELGLIKQKGFESYFLVVADMVAYAKERMLVGPSRGSAAGSLVCYLTGITEIDPIPAGLYFERFIDVNRTDMPDIDLDFPDAKRQLVFDYMEAKYGSEHVAHIGTISQYRPKSALMQVCKAIGLPPSASGALKATLGDMSLREAIENVEAGRQFAKIYPDAAVSAIALQGHASHTGVHAAGLLVSHDRIADYCTVGEDGIAHIDKAAAEELGLLKIDVLGLRTLSVLEDAEEMLGEKVGWYHLPLDDKATLDLFGSGRYCGVFQYEGAAMRKVAASMPIETIEDIDAVTALARPGPMQSGIVDKFVERRNGKPYAPIHPAVAEAMKKTFGLPLYQEQTMAIVREVGGLSWADTTGVRKAISKSKGEEAFRQYYDKFLAGAASSGLTERQAKETWDGIVAMGGYQMNKAHTYSYAVISYWTAWLKAHHPLEFAAATLRSAKDEDSAIALLREMHREGIEHIPFSMEHSRENWTVHEGKLVGGFTALVGIGAIKAAELVRLRDSGCLTAEHKADIEGRGNIFADIYPIKTRYAEMYEHPRHYGIVGGISMIGDIEEGVPHGHEHVFIAEVLHKGVRDANEPMLVEKRKGKLILGNSTYLDLRLQDDTGMIMGRVSWQDYDRIGRSLNEEVDVGDYLLVRAKFFNGFRYAFVTKWKKI